MLAGLRPSEKGTAFKETRTGKQRRRTAPRAGSPGSLHGLPGHHSTCTAGPGRSLTMKLTCSPEVDLSQRLQQLGPHQPVGAVPQAQQICDQLQPQLTVAAAAEAHDAVLGTESEATAMATVAGQGLQPHQRAATSWTHTCPTPEMLTVQTSPR